MTRVRFLSLTVLLSLSAGAGCVGPGSPWNRQARKPAVAPAAAADPQALAEAEPASEPADSGAGVAPASAVEVHQRMQEFLDKIAEYDTADAAETSEQGFVSARAGAESVRGPYEPVVPAGQPGVNVGVDLTAAEGEDDGDAEPPPAVARAPVKPRIERVAIRSSPSVDGAGVQEPPNMGVNTSLETSTELIGDSVGDTIESLRQHVADHPNDVDALWPLVLLLMASGQDFEISELVGEVSSETGDTIATMADVIRRVREAVAEPGPAADHALEAINALRVRFTRDAELLLPTVALCTRVSTFGVYDEMDPSLLVPYRANRAIVYCEIRNFFSDRMPDDTFRVTLSSRLEILTADGQSVWTHEEPNIEDVSRQRREDFFLAQLVTFPPELGPGDYVLKVMIEDTSAAKAAEAVHRFRIGSSALSAAGP
ncbi:MAG: hypothetical protein JSV19_05355 [Phycisphaerales bacterium]|nr:MAG: hypothetical protein JSV19_05355 [Phycisphaerales bacterium]